MTVLAPLTVAIPLLAASVLVGTAGLTSRRVLDTVCSAVSVTVAVLCAIVLHQVSETSGPLLHWFGGWTPRSLSGHPVAIGVDFAIDRVGASLALFVAGLFVAAFAFAWRFFTVAGPLFHALLLVFLAACMGFAFSGDLFNLFVFIELLSVSAFALTAYDVEEEGPLQGTLNFAVTNSIGALLLLTGIALLYARTGELNLAAIGDSLTTAGRVDGLVVGAFTLICVGLLVKAAVVPFHFWLGDAYAVAPTPVCLLLSAAVSELGLYALARVYWVVFSGVIEPSDALRVIFIALGVLTALVGATMAVAQRHLKRLLAFTTISHVGLYLIGFGLLSAEALAGTTVYVMADGLAKAALFAAVGLLQHRWGTVDELSLRGSGRRMPITAGIWLAGTIALVGLPPFGGFLGKSMIDGAATDAGYGWVVIVFVVCAALTAGAVLRAFGRVFAGWGADDLPDDIESLRGDEADPELGTRRDRIPVVVTVVAGVLAVCAVAAPLVPGLRDGAGVAAAQLQDREGYTAAVLGGAMGAGHAGDPGAAAPASPRPPAAPASPRPPAAPASPRHPVTPAHGPELKDVLAGIAAALLAVGLAATALRRGRLRDQLPGRAGELLRSGLHALRALHSGQVGDYVLWIVLGLLALGGALGLGV